jgi:hypothetical protein
MMKLANVRKFSKKNPMFNSDKKRRSMNKIRLLVDKIKNLHFKFDLGISEYNKRKLIKSGSELLYSEKLFKSGASNREIFVNNAFLEIKFNSKPYIIDQWTVNFIEIRKTIREKIEDLSFEEIVNLDRFVIKKWRGTTYFFRCTPKLRLNLIKNKIKSYFKILPNPHLNVLIMEINKILIRTSKSFPDMIPKLDIKACEFLKLNINIPQIMRKGEKISIPFEKNLNNKLGFYLKEIIKEYKKYDYKKIFTFNYYRLHEIMDQLEEAWEKLTAKPKQSARIVEISDDDDRSNSILDPIISSKKEEKARNIKAFRTHYKKRLALKEAQEEYEIFMRYSKENLESFQDLNFFESLLDESNMIDSELTQVKLIECSELKKVELPIKGNKRVIPSADQDDKLVNACFVHRLVLPLGTKLPAKFEKIITELSVKLNISKEDVRKYNNIRVENLKQEKLSQSVKIIQLKERWVETKSFGGKYYYWRENEDFKRSSLQFHVHHAQIMKTIKKKDFSNYFPNKPEFKNIREFPKTNEYRSVECWKRIDSDVKIDSDYIKDLFDLEKSSILKFIKSQRINLVLTIYSINGFSVFRDTETSRELKKRILESIKFLDDLEKRKFFYSVNNFFSLDLV